MKKGSVSLFAAMVFLLLLSLIITTIESARIQGGKVMVSTALSMGLDSVFAGFDEELFSEFGVLLLQGKENSVLWNKYIARWLCYSHRNGCNKYDSTRFKS